MINIEFYHNGLIINGHANANEYNKDIYCAAVSAISQGALNWFEEQDVTYEIKDGFLKLVINNCSNNNLDKLNLLKIQLSALDDNKCKQYIKFKTFKKDLENDK